MNPFRFFKSMNTQKSVADRPAVKEAARKAIDKYEKTFIDLARYDRGNKSFRPISR